MPEVPVWIGGLFPGFVFVAGLLGFPQPVKRTATAGLVAGIGALAIVPAILAAVGLALKGRATCAIAQGVALRIDPLRLSVCFEAPREAMSAIL